MDTLFVSKLLIYVGGIFLEKPFTMYPRVSRKVTSLSSVR